MAQALDEETRKQVESLFHMASFQDMYAAIHRVYSDLDLGEGLADEERIREYKYVTEQFRKYLASHQDQVLAHGSDFDGMLQEMRRLMAQASEYRTTRKELVYAFLRDKWIAEATNAIAWIAEEWTKEVQGE